jgi:YgiT-type zinc finger domain-containing protein
MRCTSCATGHTVATTRPKAVERDGRLAVVQGVPVEVCETCCDVYLDTFVVQRLDDVVNRILTGAAEVAFAGYVSPQGLPS